MTAKKLRVLDTFAGAGGFSLGFEMAGYHILGGIEIDKWAAETFSFNHPNCKVLVGDISSYSERQLSQAFRDESPEVILGGPPCQGFSICNKNAGDSADPRNSLFSEFIRMGKIFRPRYMVMENVPNLMRAKTRNGEKVISIIESSLKKMDYYVYSSVLEATDYGVPQIRKRLFVIASIHQLERPFPEPTHIASQIKPANLLSAGLKTCPTLWDAISDLPQLEAREGMEEMKYQIKPQNEFQRVMRKGCKVVYNHIAMKHSRRLVERFASMSWGHSTADVPAKHRPWKRSGNGQTSDRIYDQNNRRMHPYRPCHTIPACFYANFVHPFINRNFTPREGARIQSFPDRYVFKGKPTVVSHRLLEREGRVNEKYLCQYNQIGNAVPPLLAKAIAENLARQDKGT
jgi:DNA (cytosine-5)-methyltransferase 1